MAASAARTPRLRAWRPDLPGVSEVLHAYFPDHAYPLHTHDTWTVLVVDSGVVRYDLDRHEHGALGGLVTVLPPHVPHDGRSVDATGFRKRVVYLEEGALDASRIGSAVDHPGWSDPLPARAGRPSPPGARTPRRRLRGGDPARSRAGTADQPPERDRSSRRTP